MSDPFYRSPAWRQLRAAVIRRSRGRCEAPGCGERGKVVDHVVSRRRGGSDTLDNLRHLCRRHDNAVKEAAGGGERRRGGVLPGARADGAPADPAHPWHGAGGIDHRGAAPIDRRCSRIRTKFGGR